jgi:inner membrane protein
MDNLTHSLTGLIIAKAGVERLSPGAAAVCVVAANAPDFDLAFLLGGRWTYLHNHRGITHSILGVLILAVLVPLIFYGVEFAWSRFRKREHRFRYGGLLLASLIASATHPLMDWTNNYGIRFLLPWSGKWFYGDLVFIVDPLLWLVLGGAGFLLASRLRRQLIFWCALGAILTLALFLLPQQREAIPHIGIFRAVWVIVLAGFFAARRAEWGQRFGPRLAPIAIAVVVGYWIALAVAHQRALGTAGRFAEALAGSRNEKVIQLAAMPMLADPFHWQCISETDHATYRFKVSLLDSLQVSSEVERFEEPNPRELAAIDRASGDDRAKVFLDFARFPATRVKDLDCISQTVVQFADLRYTEPGGAQRGTFSLDVPIACPEVK